MNTISPTSALSLHIIVAVKSAGAKGITGYDIHKSLSDFWSHQQVYRDCSRLAKSGLLFPTVKNNDGKPDSKVYLFSENAFSDLNNFFVTVMMPFFKEKAHLITEDYLLAYIEFRKAEVISKVVQEMSDKALLEALIKEEAKWVKLHSEAKQNEALYAHKSSEAFAKMSMVHYLTGTENEK
ncbi:transcriptional regulator [Vibrio phage vB_VpaS_1601]|uniref:transcriptional regulator n=1 Tax=Vibrio phage SHOU24 TaxID=1414739 RepID=UPI0003ED2162|nr:transcriptional regulator [Vibrio phage SHOU24]AHI61208.1 transcriptional regulator [Vibrio phage SHOU24]WHM52763.1 transcriptional regulator [Vibrio phage vB_VpaP_1601]